MTNLTGVPVSGLAGLVCISCTGVYCPTIILALRLELVIAYQTADD